MDKVNPHCSCVHHAFAPLALVLIGIAFLLNALGILSSGFLAIAWPILLIGAGVVKLLGRQCMCCGHS